MKNMTLFAVPVKKECIAQIKTKDTHLTSEIINKILPDVIGNLGLTITTPRKWIKGLRGINLETNKGIFHIEKEDNVLRVYNTEERLMLLDDWDF